VGEKGGKQTYLRKKENDRPRAKGEVYIGPGLMKKKKPGKETISSEKPGPCANPTAVKTLGKRSVGGGNLIEDRERNMC